MYPKRSSYILSTVHLASAIIIIVTLTACADTMSEPVNPGQSTFDAPNYKRQQTER